MASWLKSLQVISVMTNLFVVLCGVAIVIAGAVTLMAETGYFSITDNNTELYRLPYSLILLGVCVMCMALLGLVGSVTARMIGGRILLGVYIFVLILITFSEIAAGGSALRARTTDTFEQTYINSSNTSFMDYIHHRDAWDKFQRAHKCCGVLNYTSYEKSNLPIPKSCCKDPQSSLCDAARNSSNDTYLYTRGCPATVLHILQDYFVMIGVVMIILGLGQYIGVIVGCLLVYVSSKDDNGEKTPYSYHRLRTVQT